MSKKKVPIIEDIHSTIREVVDVLRKQQVTLQDKINDLETDRENIGEVIEALDAASEYLPH